VGELIFNVKIPDIVIGKVFAGQPCKHHNDGCPDQGEPICFDKIDNLNQRVLRRPLSPWIQSCPTPLQI
jgi:hypothetical protein